MLQPGPGAFALAMQVSSTKLLLQPLVTALKGCIQVATHPVVGLLIFGLECCSAVQLLPTMHENLGTISGTALPLPQRWIQGNKV